MWHASCTLWKRDVNVLIAAALVYFSASLLLRVCCYLGPACICAIYWSSILQNSMKTLIALDLTEAGNPAHQTM